MFPLFEMLSRPARLGTFSVTGPQRAGYMLVSLSALIRLTWHTEL